MTEECVRVLLACCDAAMLSAGSRALYEAGYEVCGLCDNGPDTIRMIAAMEPDVVLMSAFLREGDAFSVLQWLDGARLSSMPAVALALPFGQDEYVRRALELGVYAVIGMPAQPDDLVAAVRAAQPLDRMIPCFARESAIRDILVSMSLDRKRKGFEQLVTAVGIACRSHRFYRALSTVVYPETARLHGAKPLQIERNIRSAIETAWNKGDLERQYACFGNTVDENRGKPTNSEFIARITEALRLEAM